MAIQYVDTVPGATADADGIFIPIGDLYGISAGEFTTGTDNTKESKFVYALLTTLAEELPTDSLGISVTKGTIAGVSNSVYNIQFTANSVFMDKFADKTVNVLPVPVSGANLDVGKVSILDIFANAQKVAASDTLPGEGIVIPSGDVDDYFAPAHASLTVGASSDNRDWIVGVINYLAGTLAVRSTSNASALVNKSKTSSTYTVPAAAYAATDPTMGLVAADLLNRNFYQQNWIFTIQLVINEATQSFDVRVVAA